MIHFSLKARPATPSQRCRPTRCPRLERLEDRVVPSIPDQAILVTNSPSDYNGQPPSTVQTGILQVDPSDPNNPSFLGQGRAGLMTLPYYMVAADIGGFGNMLYVTDYTIFGRGAGGVFQVDPSTSTGIPTLISPSNYDLQVGNHLVAPAAITAVNGSLYIGDAGSDGYRAGEPIGPSVHAPNLVQLTYSSGQWQQSLVPTVTGSYFRDPVGLVPVPGDDQDLYWADGIYGGGAIFKVNLLTGAQTILTQGGLLNSPIGMVQDLDPNTGIPTGNLLVVNGGDGNVIRVYDDGSQFQIASLGMSGHLNSVAVGSGYYGPETIFVGAIANGTTPGKVYIVNPATGDYDILSTGGNLSLVEGMALSGGSLYVGTAPSPQSTQDPSSFPIGIIQVNPFTGDSNPLYVRPSGLFCLPIDICEDSTGRYLYVADLTAIDTGAVIQIDTSTNPPTQTLLAWGNLIDGPEHIAFINGEIYVTNVGDSSFMTHRLVRIDPSTQNNQTLIADNFKLPEGVAPVYNNGVLDTSSVYILDENGNVADDAPGQIYKVMLSDGTESPFGSSYPTVGEQAEPAGIAWDPYGAPGAYYVMTLGWDPDANPPSGGYSGGVHSVDQAGTRTLISGTSFPGETADEFQQFGDRDDGTYLVGVNYITLGSPAQYGSSRVFLSTIYFKIVSVDTSSGAQSPFSESSLFSLLGGLIVYSSTGGPAAAPPRRSFPVTPLVNYAQAVNADLSPRVTFLSCTTVAIWPQALAVGVPSQLLPALAGARDTGSTGPRIKPPTALVDSLFADWDNSGFAAGVERYTDCC